MTIRETDRLRICRDCYYWAEYGWEPGAVYPEGWDGPTHSSILGAVYVETDCHYCEQSCDGHFSWAGCDGCGSPLGGDLLAVITYAQEERL